MFKMQSLKNGETRSDTCESRQIVDLNISQVRNVHSKNAIVECIPQGIVRVNVHRIQSACQRSISGAEYLDPPEDAPLHKLNIDNLKLHPLSSEFVSVNLPPDDVELISKFNSPTARNTCVEQLSSLVTIGTDHETSQLSEDDFHAYLEIQHMSENDVLFQIEEATHSKSCCLKLCFIPAKLFCCRYGTK